MSDPTIRLSSCRGTGCPECGRDVPYSGGLLPTLCECRVCSSGCFSQHERRLLTEALNRLQTVQQDLQEARRERDMFEERAWKYDQLCK